MNLTFYADKPTAPKSAIMLSITFANTRIRFGTGVTVSPELWNHSKQQIRVGDPLRNAHQKRLDTIYTTIQRLYNEMNLGTEGRIFAQDEIKAFKKRIKTFLQTGSAAVSTANLFEYYDDFVESYTIKTKTGQITTRRPSEGTLIVYRRLGKTLKQYCAERRKVLTFDSINAEFYTSFMDWLANTKDLLDSSSGNYIKCLKTFMSWAMEPERKLHTNIAFLKFHKPEARSNTGKVALTLSELRAWRDADLSEHPRLRRVRDIHLLQSYTALRYGDLELLQPINFDRVNGFIRTPTQKTDSRDVVIPITPPIERLLESYPSLLFEFPSNVKQNEYLKEIGRIIGLDAPVVVRKRKDGKRIETVVPKWQLLTTHSARRTFTTISIEKFGLPGPVVRRVTGHASKDEMEESYFKGTEEAIQNLICNAWAAF